MTNDDGTENGNERKLIPIPTDLTIAQYSEMQIESHKEFFEFVLSDLKLTAEQTEQEGEPRVFTYVKMLRHFTENLEKSELVQLAASALWRAYLEDENVS